MLELRTIKAAKHINDPTPRGFQNNRLHHHTRNVSYFMNGRLHRLHSGVNSVVYAQSQPQKLTIENLTPK